MDRRRAGMVLVFLVMVSGIPVGAGIRTGQEPGDSSQLDTLKRDLPTYVIEHASLISMASGQKRMLRDRTIVVRNGLIDAVVESSKSGELDLPEDTVVIPAGGKFLMPGLIDAHVHLKYWTRIFPELNSPVYDLEDLNTLHLANGITTIYNLATYYPEILQWGKQIERGAILGPTIYCATRPFLDVVYPTEAEVSAAVRRFSNRGYLALKVYGPMSLANYRALIDSAEVYGMDVIGHVPRGEGIKLDYVLNHQKMICHTFFVYIQAFGYDFFNVTEWQVRTLASQIQAAGTVIQPTAAASQKDVLYMDSSWVARMALDERMKYVPEGARAIWLDGSRWALSGEDAEYARRAWELERVLNREMRKAGVVMSVGSDAPVRPFHLYGYALHDEMKLFAEDMGFSVFKTLEAATRGNAEWMGILDRVGTIEEGKAADLLLLRKNPLKKLKHLRRLEGIMLHGRWLSRKDLRDRLRTLERKMGLAVE